jgi:probable HAF family extracellular repeat protein
MLHRLAWSLAGVVTGTLLLLAVSSGAASYTFTTLDVPDAGAEGTAASGINNHGQIVGGYLDSGNQDQGFLTRRGRWTTLPHTAPQSINNQGQITGFYGDRTGVHGFLYEKGVVSTLDVPGATRLGRELTEATGINDRGQIVGDYRDSQGDFHGFLYERGTFTTVDVPFPHIDTGPTGINNRGQIVGFYDDGTRRRGFLKDGTVFTPLDVPGALGTLPFGINNHGHIVGIYFTSMDPTGNRGFVYDGQRFTPVHVPTAVLTEPRGINDRGQLVGRYLDEHGEEHGFLATPVPPAVVDRDERAR